MYYLLVITLLSTSFSSPEWETDLKNLQTIVQPIPLDHTITLDDPWTIPETIRIIHKQDTLRKGIDYYIPDSTLSIHIFPSENLPVGDSLTVEFLSASVINRHLFFRFALDSSDIGFDSSSLEVGDVKGRSTDPLGDWGNLRRKGSLTRGISFGDNEGGITSGLYLELSGKPAKDVTVDAILDDRTIPATSEGGSKTLSELDRIMFRISAPHIEAEMGDWDLNWQKGIYGQVQRGLKGGRVNLHYHPVRAEAVVAGGDNTYQHITFNGRTGDQGPYELIDRFGQPGVTVMSGSETVYLDGARLVNGKFEDYTLDYQLGMLYFNPGIPIRSDSRIEIEYEYNEESYPHYFYAGGLGWSSLPESTNRGYSGIDKRSSYQRNQSDTEGFSIETFAVMEGRDEDNPLAFEWSEEWRHAVQSAGDDAFGAVVNGVDSVGSGLGDYTWDTIDNHRILVFSPPDSIGRPTGYLRITFSSDSTGSYRRIYDSSLQLYYYEWAGEGEGNWSPVIRIPLPDRTRMADMILKFNRGSLQFLSESAVSNYDANTFSDVNDNDNVGMAFRWRGAWNEGESALLSLVTSASHEQDRFKPISRSRDVDYAYRWNLTDSLQGSETSLESELSIHPFKTVSFAGVFGYLDRKERSLNRRIGINGDWLGHAVALSSSVNRNYSNNRTSELKTVRDRLSAGIRGTKYRFRTQYTVNYESSKREGEHGNLPGYSYQDHELAAELKLNNHDKLQLQLGYRSDDSLSGNRSEHQSDTRIYEAEYQGSRNSGSSWHIRAHRLIQSFVDPMISSISSTVLNTECRYTPTDAIWRGYIEYNLSSGSQRIGTWVASYVGENQGDYRREADRYVPDPDGDFTLNQISSDTLRNVKSVRFTGSMGWDLRKRRGKTDSTNGYPLGITGMSSRVETELTTGSRDNWQVFLLYPSVFRQQEIQSSKSSFRQDIDFLKGNPRGDGRITFKWREDRDRAAAGGEANNSKYIETMIRSYFTGNASIQLKPLLSREKRWGLVIGELRSDVSETGGEVELVSTSQDQKLEASIGFGYIERKNNFGGGAVIERTWFPALNYNLGMKGIIRTEGEWRHLSASIVNPGYDLDGGYPIGDSYKLMVSFEYSLGNNLSLSAYYRGRWRGTRTPRHDGLMELTATL